VELNKQKINELRTKIEKKNSVFSQKRFLDSMFLPSKIIGREKETEMLLQHVLSLKDGFVVPFVSVYGRSGSGKSTVVKFVCENLDDLVSFRFANLRKAKTVFGCANMILSELGEKPLTSAEGLNKSIDCMQKQIKLILNKEDKKFFVLVLDEYDVIFSDTRSNPSDFVYKLLQMEENLRENGYWMCTITISNNAMQEQDLDDRVKSRMGGAAVPFAPYTKSDVLGILQDRAKQAFKIKVSKEILEYCSELSSSDHGDARRALDLLRTAGESCDGKKITKEDVDNSLKYLQKDRAQEIVSSAPYHMRCVAAAICSLAIVSEESWAATSSIYKKYTEVTSKDKKPLSYRRVSDLLVELENSGLVVSRAYSRGRNGYGKEYKLKVSPDLIGPSIDPDFFESLVERKASIDTSKKLQKSLKSLKRSNLWSRYSGLLDDI
jgi:cell division control protein 6